jgi:TRAP-type C4-dicarboxylate transport system substrate-binding protein
MKRFFGISMVAVLLTGLIVGVYAPAPTPAEKSIELTITYYYPIGSSQDKYAQRWAKKVEEDSKGRLKFKIYGGGVLVNAFETYSSIAKGVADIGFGPRYGVGAPFTDVLLSMGLMGTPDVATSTLVVDDLMKKFPKQYTKEWGDTKILWIQADAASCPITRAKPVRTIEDMKGLELRGPIKSVAEAFKAMGAKPVVMPMADYVIGLQKGTVDGGTCTIWGLKSFNLVPLAKYFTEFALVSNPALYMVMNLDKWKALPPDLQKVIDDNCKWGKRESVKMFDEEDQSCKEWAIKHGMEFITLKPDEKKRWAAFLEPVYLRLAAELDAKGYPASSAFRFAQERLTHHAK